MYLKQIAIGTDGGDLPGGKTHKDFNLSTWAAGDIFMKALGKKYNLHDTKKINIRLGVKQDLPNKYTRLIDVGMFFYDENFNFKAYFDMTKYDQEHLLLKIIKESLCEIAEIVGVSTEDIEKAYKETLKQNFPLDNLLLETWGLEVQKRQEARKQNS